MYQPPHIVGFDPLDNLDDVLNHSVVRCHSSEMLGPVTERVSGAAF